MNRLYRRSCASSCERPARRWLRLDLARPTATSARSSRPTACATWPRSRAPRATTHASRAGRHRPALYQLQGTHPALCAASASDDGCRRFEAARRRPESTRCSSATTSSQRARRRRARALRGLARHASATAGRVRVPGPRRDHAQPLTRDALRHRGPKVALPRYRTGATSCAGCCRRTCPASSPSPPASSRSSARARTPRACSPARAAPSAPTGASTTSPRHAGQAPVDRLRLGDPLRRGPRRRARTSTARSATRASRSPPSTTPRSSTPASTCARRPRRCR